MYIHLHGLGQPTRPTPQPVIPGPPPVPMPNPLAPPPPIVSPPAILLVRSRVECSAAQLAAIRGVVGPGTVITDAVVRLAIQSGRKLTVSERAIITPAARDLGEQHRVFTVAPWRG